MEKNASPLPSAKDAGPERAAPLTVEQFVRERFSSYYSNACPVPPPSAQSREWGFGSWDRKIESRHALFHSADELHAYLRRNAPFYISYSSAYYEFPDARPMERKHWLGADLIFDIDADQLNPPCAEKHGSGWVCDTCLGLAKDEAVKLIEEFLAGDFGFSKDKMTLNFSGNRGYHVHVFEDDVKALSGPERREIADYIMGKGVDPGTFYWTEHTVDSRSGKTYRRLVGPKRDDPGWRGKIARAFARSLRERKLEGLGIKPRVSKKFYSREQEVLAGIDSGNWDVVGVRDKAGFWASIASRQSVRLGDNIDQNVTFDTSKLIRMPDSLHGETGLLAKRTSDLDRFDPFRDAVAFGKDPVRIRIRESPEIRFWGKVFGPYENKTLELPEAVAVYLLCKRRAALP